MPEGRARYPKATCSGPKRSRRLRGRSPRGGFSFLEHSQILTGETTIRQADMVFAVAVWATLEIFWAQIRDSSVITESGWEEFTNHPKSVEDLML